MKKIKCRGCGKRREEFRGCWKGLTIGRGRCRRCTERLTRRVINGADAPFWCAVLFDEALPSDMVIRSFDVSAGVRKLKAQAEKLQRDGRKLVEAGYAIEHRLDRMRRARLEAAERAWRASPPTTATVVVTKKATTETVV